MHDFPRELANLVLRRALAYGDSLDKADAVIPVWPIQ